MQTTWYDASKELPNEGESNLIIRIRLEKDNRLFYDVVDFIHGQFIDQTDYNWNYNIKKYEEFSWTRIE